MYRALKDRVVIITGASRGIGRATAQELARANARLVLVGRDVQALGAVVQETRALGAESCAYPLDVRDFDAIPMFTQSVLNAYGTVDVLINNAAVGKYGGFLDLTMDDWHNMVSTNLLGLVAMTQAVLPTMIQNRSGHIVNISSIQGKQATATSSAYSATKFGVMAVTQSLQHEMRRFGIRVTALCPGSVETDFDGFPGSEKVNPLTPEDVALAIRDVVETNGRAYVMETVLMPIWGP
jgi:3-oxoacyl-[acyl-carrier protein] reductase